MSRYHSYISSALKIIGTYDGSKPFAYHLKTFFGLEKKYGSRDRKTISALCYNYFRLGHALKNVSAEEKMLTGLFLCETKSNEVLALLRPDWNDKVTLSVSEKLLLLNIDLFDIFPFAEQLADGIEKDLFILSFLKQPDLYLRLRPGKSKQVTDKLTRAAIQFEVVSDSCLKLTNNTSLDAVLEINREAVVQDQNSQLVLNFLESTGNPLSKETRIHAWDCCAASGGKSMLLHDVLKGNVRLTVSDIRENILVNLAKRLQQAGINIYRKFIADISKEKVLPASDLFSIVICDAPCTGSGTWSRTPEQLFYFDESSIALYAGKQKKIVSNSIPHLQPKGLFFYITCSVFKKENEEVVAYIKEKFHLPLLQMEYLKGYDKKTDNLFVAVFTK